MSSSIVSLLLVFLCSSQISDCCFIELLLWCEPELMVFGLLSLLMGHWIAFVAKICVKPSALMSSRFYPCAPNKYVQHQALRKRHTVVFRSDHFNSSIPRLLLEDLNHDYCPEVFFARSLCTNNLFFHFH